MKAKYKAVVHTAWEIVIPADNIITRNMQGEVVNTIPVPEMRFSYPVGKVIEFDNKKVMNGFMKGVHGSKVTLQN